MNKRITLHPVTPGWMIQSDFDGTISAVDVTDSLLNRFGQAGWQDLEDQWERGEIGSRECMKGQIALLDMSEDELREHLDTIEIDPGFISFVDTARIHGVRVQVVSDGVDYAIRHVLARHGLGYLEIIANHLLQVDERHWRLEFPWASSRCQRASGNCKCERLIEQQNAVGRVLYVGDSTSDFCVSHKADFVLAKYKLIQYCQEHGISHVPFTGFSEATTVMERVVLGQEVMA